MLSRKSRFTFGECEAVFLADGDFLELHFGGQVDGHHRVEGQRALVDDGARPGGGVGVAAAALFRPHQHHLGQDFVAQLLGGGPEVGVRLEDAAHQLTRRERKLGAQRAEFTL